MGCRYHRTFMTLRLKINLIVGALTFLFIAAVMWLQLLSMRESVQEEVEAANRVAAQMLNRTAWRYAEQGTSSMLAFLEGIGRVRSNEITLLDFAGRELYRSPPSAYKAGRDAPAWFTRLVSPAMATQSINFPDGKLVVRTNASRAVLDAWDYVTLLAAGGLLFLLAANVLVFWLVGRAVKPFALIVSALNQLQTGRFDVQLPRLSGAEAAAIGGAFNHMVDQLAHQIETERRALRAELQLSNNRELTRWIDQQIERERHMIARELHDELGQSVTAMRSMALSIAQRMHTRDPQVESAARVIADESSRLYDAMHGMIPRLTPLLLDNFGLSEALDDLVARTQVNHPGVQIDLQVELGPSGLDGDAALALFRAAQEGITNALRHGQARTLHLSLEGDDAAVTMNLRDDGCGLPADGSNRVGHYGLRWLTERVEALGGRVRLAMDQPQGVHLQVQVPRSAMAAEGPA